LQSHCIAGIVGQPRPAGHVLHAPVCERVQTGRGPPAHLSRGGGPPQVPPPRAARRPVDLPAGPPKIRQVDPSLSDTRAEPGQQPL